MCGPFGPARRSRRPTGQRGEACFRSVEPKIQARGASKWVCVMLSEPTCLRCVLVSPCHDLLTALPTGASQQLPSPGSSCAALRAYPQPQIDFKTARSPWGSRAAGSERLQDPALRPDPPAHRDRVAFKLFVDHDGLHPPRGRVKQRGTTVKRQIRPRRWRHRARRSPLLRRRRTLSRPTTRAHGRPMGSAR